MVHVALALAASLSTLVSAFPAQNGERAVIPVRKGTSGDSITANDVLERDIARIAVYNGKFKPLSVRASSGTTINEDVTYIARVAFCSQTFDLIVDTGSSNTWAGAGTAVSSSCGTSTSNSFSVTYGSGSVSGTEKEGPVSYAGLTVSKQSFGAASSASGFQGVDGIIGFGPVGLTTGTVSNTNTVPTFLNNLRSQGSISAEILGVYFRPDAGSETDNGQGELTLGGVDSNKYTGPLTYFPKSTTSPYSYYWGVAVASVTYGSTTLGGSSNAIVDTGTTLIYLPHAAYNQFLTATNGKTDQSTGLARFSTKPTGTFTIKIGSTPYPLTPAQYLVPAFQYSYFGLQQGYYYSWINDGGNDSVNFIIGQKFLENYYSVYDTANSRIGFATRA